MGDQQAALPGQSSPGVFLLYEGGEVAKKLKTKLSRVRIAPLVTEIPHDTFRGCKKLVEVQLNEGLQVIGERAFEGCTSLRRSVTLPSSVIKLGEDAFRGCYNLAKVTLGEELKFIGRCAFLDCKALRSVTIPSTVTKIAPQAFRCCKNLIELRLNEGLAIIGGHAFQDCDALQIITLPSTVNELGWWAFRGCMRLSKVVYLGGERLLNREFLDRSLSDEDGILNNEVLKKMFGRMHFMHVKSCVPSIYPSPGRYLRVWEGCPQNAGPLCWKEFVSCLVLN